MLSLTTERQKRHLLSEKSLLADRVLDYFHAPIRRTASDHDASSSSIITLCSSPHAAKGAGKGGAA